MSAYWVKRSGKRGGRIWNREEIARKELKEDNGRDGQDFEE